jgi:hypothetical protein
MSRLERAVKKVLIHHGPRGITRWRDGAFKKHLLTLIRALTTPTWNESDPDFVSDWEADELLVAKRINRIPDLWRIRYDKLDKQFHLEILEIEDTCPLSADKILDYADLWWAFDSLDAPWNFSVFRCDRLGGNVTQVDLLAFYYSLHEGTKEAA